MNSLSSGIVELFLTDFFRPVTDFRIVQTEEDVEGVGEEEGDGELGTLVGDDITYLSRIFHVSAGKNFDVTEDELSISQICHQCLYHFFDHFFFIL